MTKKKKWIIGGGVFVGLIGLIILLLFTLFSLKHVEVDFRTSTTFLTATSEEIVETGEFAYGSSVVFHSKKAYKENIEKKYPYIKVINIETVFPNKFIIHVSEREEIFAVAKDDSQFYITDQEFKVLKIVESFQSLQNNPILLSGIEIKAQAIEGQFLNVSGYIDVFSALIENNRQIFEQKALIKEINFENFKNDKTNKYEILANLELFSGQEVKLYNCQKMLKEKVASFIQVFSQIYSLIGKEIKIVHENGEFEIVGTWDKETLDSAVIEINNYYLTDGIYFKILPKAYLNAGDN